MYSSFNRNMRRGCSRRSFKEVLWNLKGLTDLIAASEALKHIATFGWRRKLSDDGRGINSRKGGDSSLIVHDPEAVEKLDWLDDEVRATVLNCSIRIARGRGIELLPSVYDYLVSRDLRLPMQSLDRRLSDITKLVDDWLEDRQTMVLGCSGRQEDCFGNYDRCCGWLNAEGNCKLGRRKEFKNVS